MVDGLPAAGNVVEVADAISQPFFSVDGEEIRVDDGEIQAYEHASTEFLMKERI